MGAPSDRESLLTDLMYLRKDRGLTTGRLSLASAVIDACGGRMEQLGVLRLRLIAAIHLLEDQPNREALEAAFSLLPETRDLLTLAERRQVYGRMVRRKPDTLADREDAAIEELAGVLLAMPYHALRSLGSAGLDDLRELYRHGQEALMRVEAFDVMAMVVSALREADAGPIYRMALANISLESHFTDTALWSFAHCHRAFNRAAGDPAGAKLLRDGLPTIVWSERLERPLSGLSKRTRVAFESALLEACDADDLGRRLRQSTEAAPIERRWRRLLSAEHVASDPEGEQAGEREDLRLRLVVLCQFLARVFPEETRAPEEMRANYGVIVHECLSVVAEYATARSIPNDRHGVEKAIELAIACPLDRHIFGGKEKCVL